MAQTTFFAPVHRALGRWANLGNGGFPPDAAPSMDFLASGLQDHRLPVNSRGSSSVQPGIVGWYGAANPVVINLVPSAAATANIAALANAVNLTPMTLRAASGAGIIVLSSSAPAFFMPTGLTVSAGVVIESLPTRILFGASGTFTTGFYNRTSTVGRAISITGVTSGTGGVFKVAGYDIYGYPMNETITVGAGVNTVNGKKAWKCITSVTPQFSDAHTYSVGTADIFGFGISASLWEDTLIKYNGAVVTASTGFVAADATTATATTGDVRGTYAVQSATDGVKRLFVSITPTLTALATNPTTGLFGVAQF